MVKKQQCETLSIHLWPICLPKIDSTSFMGCLLTEVLSTWTIPCLFDESDCVAAQSPGKIKRFPALCQSIRENRAKKEARNQTNNDKHTFESGCSHVRSSRRLQVTIPWLTVFSSDSTPVLSSITQVGTRDLIHFENDRFLKRSWISDPVPYETSNVTTIPFVRRIAHCQQNLQITFQMLNKYAMVQYSLVVNRKK